MRSPPGDRGTRGESHRLIGLNSRFEITNRPGIAAPRTVRAHAACPSSSEPDSCAVPIALMFDLRFQHVEVALELASTDWAGQFGRREVACSCRGWRRGRGRRDACGRSPRAAEGRCLSLRAEPPVDLGEEPLGFLPHRRPGLEFADLLQSRSSERSRTAWAASSPAFRSAAQSATTSYH